MATKKTKTAIEEMRPFMESRSIIAGSPEELTREVNELLSHFDLYDIKYSTVPTGSGGTQFIAFVYGKERENAE